MNIMDLLRSVSSRDLFSILESVNNVCDRIALKLGINANILLWAGLAVSVLLGFLGYKLIKPLMALGVGGVGYLVGVEIFSLLDGKWSWLPNWLTYVVGGVIAVAFICMAFAKFSYALFAFAGALGFFVTNFYLDNTMIAIGGAVVLAMLSVILIRTAYILTVGTLCGFATVSFLSGLFPGVAMFDLNYDNWMPICLAAGIAVLFVVVQFVVNRHAGETIDA